MDQSFTGRRNLFDIYLFTTVERNLERNKFYYCYRERLIDYENFFISLIAIRNDNLINVINLARGICRSKVLPRLGSIDERHPPLFSPAFTLPRSIYGKTPLRHPHPLSPLSLSRRREISREEKEARSKKSLEI